MKGSLLTPVLGSPGMTGSKQQRSHLSFHLPYLTLFFFFVHGLVFFPRQAFSLGMPTLEWGKDSRWQLLTVSAHIIIQSLAASYIKLGVRTFILTRLDHILSLNWWGVPPKEGEITRKRKGVGNSRGKVVPENTKETNRCPLYIYWNLSSRGFLIWNHIRSTIQN